MEITIQFKKCNQFIALNPSEVRALSHYDSYAHISTICHNYDAYIHAQVFKHKEFNHYTALVYVHFNNDELIKYYTCSHYSDIGNIQMERKPIHSIIGALLNAGININNFNISDSFVFDVKSLFDYLCIYLGCKNKAIRTSIYFNNKEEL